MHRYFSTFQTGLYEIVKSALKEAIPDVKIEFYKDDLVLYNSSYNIVYIKNLPFLNNSFLAIKLFTNANVIDLDLQVDWALNSQQFEDVLMNSKFLAGKKFRIVLSKNNQMVSGNRSKLKLLVESINSNTSLIHDPLLPDYEIWFFQKREGYGVCGIRITKKPDYQSVLPKGELRPELAYLMNFLSEPNKDDVYIDPFCGNGSLPIARAKHFSYKQITAADIDISRLKAKLNSSNLNFKDLNLLEEDFFKAKDQQLTFNKIVTDPPWNESQAFTSLENDYERSFKRFALLLRKDGILIILSSRSELV